MEYTYKGVSLPLKKERTPICTPSGSPISSAISLPTVCDDACYNRNSYQGKCMKKTHSTSGSPVKHDGEIPGDHHHLNDVKAKARNNSKVHHDKQPNNTSASAIVTLPHYETVMVPNNIHDAGNQQFENCNDRRSSAPNQMI